MQIIRVKSAAKLFSGAPDYPSSEATPRQALNLTAIGSRETLTQLYSMVQSPPWLVEDASDVNWLGGHKPLVEFEARLRGLFDESGSDKGSFHGYSKLYARLLLQKQFDSNVRILEVGLGSNRWDVPSNMGRQGKPGASLRAWRGINPSIEIVGLDIDETILFNEDRIKTFRIDQLDSTSWQTLPQSVLHEKFDLIVDDGLHSPLANLKTLDATIEMLKPNGQIVIEDVPERALVVWSILRYLEFKGLEMRAYSFNHAFCVALGLRGSFPKY